MNQSVQHIDLPVMPHPGDLPPENDGSIASTNLKLTALKTDLCVWVILPGLTRCVPVRLAAGYEHPTTQNLSRRERLVIRALLTAALDEVAP